MNRSMLLRALLVASTLVLTACGGGGNDAGVVPGNASPVSSLNPGKVSPEDGSNDDQDIPVTEVAAIRFLEQASFGGTTEEIQRVMQLGFSGYLDEQFSMPTSVYADPQEGESTHDVKDRFFNNAMNGQDQLRQRMAFALGQIFVVSSLKVEYIDAITSYQRMLLQHAFSNYAELLREVTLHPTMGWYLDMVNNASSDNPNENYAREVMQLFSIGTVKLNNDATLKVNSLGEAIPTYTQDEVEGVARALTGWTYPTKPGSTPRNYNPYYVYGPMLAVESLHDHKEKTILGGVVLPAGQTAEADLSAVINAISSHPNVAPFMSLRLIQHFVTSNPSAAYVQRIANVFKNNGQGVRGDLKAVVKAILLDSEARRGDDPQIEPKPANLDGRLKDPVLFVTSLLRSLNASSTGIGLRWYAANMGQDVFTAPSVFNFYSPDYVIPGTHLIGPEFGIYTNSYIVARDNFINTVIFEAPSHWTVDLSEWAAMAGDPNGLVDTINLRLFHGAMKDVTRTIIVSTVEAIPTSDPLGRAKAALYLAATSAEYFVHH